MKKSVVMALSIALSAMLAISGTLAYLQDQDEAVNVMTLGNVYIDQIEQEWNAEKTELVEFKQNKPLYPFVGVNNGWELTDQKDGAYRRLANMENVVDKYVSVKNTGKSDAYVRTIIALEMGSMSYDDLCNTISASINAENGSEFKFPGAWVWPFDGVATIDGKTYNVMVAVHQDAVKPGETTIPSLLQVYMKSEAGNAEVEALDGNGNGLYDILVLSQAVQTAGFENAEAALDTAFGKVFVKDASGKLEAAIKDGATETNLNEWFSNVTPVNAVSDADGLIEALEKNGTVVFTDDIKINPAGMSNAYGTTGINVKNGQTIDGAGHTLDIKGAGGTWDSGINTTGGLIKDLTVTGSFRGIFINHNSEHSEPVVLENVTIEGTTYTISCDQGKNQNFEATGSTFNGWTSYAKTLGNAKFTDCYFGEGNGYAYCRPYAPTEFVGCEFEADYTVDPRAAVTFENCTLDGQPLTADNLKELVVTSYLANATVK